MSSFGCERTRLAWASGSSPGAGPRSYLSRNLRPRIGSRWRLRLYDLPGCNLCGPFGFQTSPETADVRSEAGDAEGDLGVFFQPFANAFHALSSIYCSFNVGPECPDLTGFGCRLIRAMSCKPGSGERKPVER